MSGKRRYNDYGDRDGDLRAHKQRKGDYNGSGVGQYYDRKQFSSIGSNNEPLSYARQQKPGYKDGVAKLPPATSTLPPVHAYTPFTVPSSLPPLPEIADPALASAPFKHKSTAPSYNRSLSTAEAAVTYEKLEFLGDAQLEHMASRLLYTRYGHLLAGQQSQLRELLVKNETLAEYARAYAFDKRVQVGDMERMVHDAEARGKANKGFNKVLGDVFEAYVAAVVLSYPDDGFAVAEKWMTGLWAPKLVEAAAKDSRYTTPGTGVQLQHDEATTGPLRTYNPTAKQDLQKLILDHSTKLEYEPYRESEELKGDRLGQNRHFIAVYLTGYGYERKLLGKGEGSNKVEAGNWAAQEAMYGECKDIVNKCAEKLAVIREQKRKDREARQAEKAKAEGKEQKEAEEKAQDDLGLCLAKFPLERP